MDALIGIRHLSHWLGDEAVWYRTLPQIETRLCELEIPDDEALWGWGYFRRSTGDYRAHVLEGFRDLTDCVAQERLRFDAVFGCSPCHGDPGRFVEALTLEILPRLDARPQSLRMVAGHDCVNLLQAVSEARALIADGCEAVLVLAAEKVDNEANRFRKYSLFSDFCLALVVSRHLERCSYEIRDVLVSADPRPREDTSAIFMRSLEDRCVRQLLARNGLDPASVSRFLYLNLYDPIAEMKARQIGFQPAQICTQLAREIGHCYGADPFIALQRLPGARATRGQTILCASGRSHAGAAVVQPRAEA